MKDEGDKPPVESDNLICPTVEDNTQDTTSDTNVIDSVNSWNTCCRVRSDKRFLRFLITTIISFIITIFSCYQLSKTKPDGCKETCDTSSIQLYTGLITLILGYYLPNPDV